MCNADPGIAAFPLFESALPLLAAPDGTPALLAGVSNDGLVRRSGAEGQPGTWHDFGGRNAGYPQVLGEVPPSPALPDGRILLGVWNGVLYSSTLTDSTATFTRSSAYGNAAYIVWSFAFRPVAGHPYGGVALAGVTDIAFGGERAGAALLASEDGGTTWTTAHRFTAADLELPVFPGELYDLDVTTVRSLFVAPDGAIWAGVDFNTGASVPARGGIARSVDGGVTWHRADGGFRDATGRGYGVSQFALSRDGATLYAATTHGVWRTSDVAVASEAPPSEAPRLGLTVHPNPSSASGASVSLALAEASEATVTVYDLLGRVVATPLVGAFAAGEHRAVVEAGVLAPGVYVVRAVVRSGGAETVQTLRLTVVR